MIDAHRSVRLDGAVSPYGPFHGYTLSGAGKELLSYATKADRGQFSKYSDRICVRGPLKAKAATDGLLDEKTVREMEAGYPVGFLR